MVQVKAVNATRMVSGWIWMGAAVGSAVLLCVVFDFIVAVKTCSMYALFYPSFDILLGNGNHLMTKFVSIYWMVMPVSNGFWILCETSHVSRSDVVMESSLVAVILFIGLCSQGGCDPHFSFSGWSICISTWNSSDAETSLCKSHQTQEDRMFCLTKLRLNPSWFELLELG